MTSQMRLDTRFLKNPPPLNGIAVLLRVTVNFH